MANRKARRTAASKQRVEGSDVRTRGMETRYDGQTYEIRIYLNTKRTATEMAAVYEALKASTLVRGAAMDQIAIMVAELDGDAAKEFWGQTYEVVEKMVGRQN